MSKLTVTLSTLLLLLVALMTLGETSPLKIDMHKNAQNTKCCTEYQKDPIPKMRLREYAIQHIRGRCNIKAVIFTTVKRDWDRPVCADPSQQWVQDAIERIK
ncbi:eotaxin-like [Coregonus clupeaformis]|uniref:eotaxin-like n=1 Tax=Coregonus clupeaformis TaxID=59861 RepID=UPI001E1C8AFB|nr:eotaxin-like [Coregonus clupeaformis]